MSENIPLTMAPRPEDKKRKVALQVAILLLVILLLAAVYFFVLKSESVSVRAVADGMIYTVSPEISAPVLELLVEEGSPVHKGQVVARMDTSSYSRELKDAGREVASLRPPDMDEISRRLKSSEEAENNAVERIAKVRHEEEAKQRQMEAYVLEHVRSQLAMRSLAHLGPGHPDYRAASEAETAARKRMEASKEEFEHTSRIRAALSQELTRIHNEVLEAKRLASLSRYQRRPAPSVRTSQRPLGGGTEVLSPVDGSVVRISARKGEQVQMGDPLLLIMPSGREQSLWVQAWFSLSERKRLHSGLPCRVERESDGRSYTGSLEAILAPHTITDEPKGELFLPVRVRLDTTEGLSPGDAVRCRVRSEWP